MRGAVVIRYPLVDRADNDIGPDWEFTAERNGPSRRISRSCTERLSLKRLTLEQPVHVVNHQRLRLLAGPNVHAEGGQGATELGATQQSTRVNSSLMKNGFSAKIGATATKLTLRVAPWPTF